MRDLAAFARRLRAAVPQWPETVTWPADGDDRGISEAIGYVLVFSLVIMTVAVVGTLGIGQLETVREYEQMNNMERSFEVMATNIDEIVLDGAPSRASEVKLGGGTVSVGETVTLNVSVTYDNGSHVFDTAPFEIRPIEYTDGTGSKVVYTGGALFRQDPSGTAVVRGPPGIYSTERTVVPVVQIRQEDVGSVTGDSTVLMRAQHAQSEQILGGQNGPYHLTVEIDSPRAAAWASYFEAQGFDSCSVTDTIATCTLNNIQRLHVTVVRIDVAME